MLMKAMSKMPTPMAAARFTTGRVNASIAVCMVMAAVCSPTFGATRSGQNGIEYKYYCPRSNSTYVAIGNHVQIVNGPFLPFPRTQSAVGGREESARRSAETTDCSTSEFFCLRVEPGLGLAALHLFLPRVIEPGRSYIFNGMEAVTYFSTSGQPPTSHVQVVLWQRIDSRETPITLTVESNRGVIYSDGLELWDSPAMWPPRPETCVLDSEHGLFNDVRIRIPKEQPQPLPE